jgi:hypothetical protein
MAGSVLNLCETASLRASLNVYVIGLPFHDSPCMGPNLSPSIRHHPWAVSIIGIDTLWLNYTFLYTEQFVTSHADIYRQQGERVGNGHKKDCNEFLSYFETVTASKCSRLLPPAGQDENILWTPVPNALDFTLSASGAPNTPTRDPATSEWQRQGAVWPAVWSDGPSRRRRG